MLNIITAAILWLAPQLVPTTAVHYAQAIISESERHDIDPFLVVALIHCESRFKRLAYVSRNYGLMQVRVSKSNYAYYRGRERLLFNARFNIKLGMHLLKFWKKYHDSTCRKRRHYWWSHYQWGAIVRNPGSGRRVDKVYTKLRIWADGGNNKRTRVSWESAISNRTLRAAPNAVGNSLVDPEVLCKPTEPAIYKVKIGEAYASPLLSLGD